MLYTQRISFNNDEFTASWLKQDLTLFVTSTVIRFSKSENSYFPTEDRESLKSILKWTGGDLNPRPLECKSSVHTS
jgi:hypothetical protein